ncbi:MAG: hypothetical protein RLZZ292_4083, partial [Bacteroidota bacterium]|jgi:uncharacterized protein (DUF1015 family)
VVCSLQFVEDYANRKIKVHEKTLIEKEKKQMALQAKWGAMVKPLLLGFPKKNATWEDLLKNNITTSSFFFEKQFESETHTFWAVTDAEQVAAFQTYFSTDIPESYVADGHHRLASGRLLHQTTQDTKYNNILTAFFPMDELLILSFNRVLIEIDTSDFLEKLNVLAHIEPKKKVFTPKQKHEFCLIFNDNFYKITWKETLIETFKPEKVALDVDILNEKILKEIFHVQDIRNDQRVLYVEGNRGKKGVLDVLSENKNALGFILYPVSAEDLMTVVDSGGIMPPKSTWFEPRMKSGLLVQQW